MKLINKHFVTILLAAVFIAFLMAYTVDIFNTIPDGKRDGFQFDSDSLVYGQLIKVNNDTDEFDDKLLGKYVNVDGEDDQTVINKQAFLSGEENEDGEYKIYTASIAFQGFFFSLVNKISWFIPRDKIDNVFFLVNAFFMACVLIVLIYWIYKEFGLAISLLSAGFIVIMPWLTIMGKSLYWIYWTDILPLAAVLAYFIYIDKKKIDYSWLVVSIIIFVTLFISFACGYEYTSVVLISMTTPLFYYGAKEQWKFGLLIKRLLSIITVSFCVFASSIVFLLWKLNNFSFANLGSSVDEILIRVAKRTGLMSESYEISQSYVDNFMNVPLLRVILNYLSGDNSNIFLNINPAALITIFIVAALVYYNTVVKNKSYSNNELTLKMKALSVMTFISFLAPLSWFVLAKGHAAAHYHINYVLWTIPFALIALVFIMVAIREMIKVFIVSNVNQQKN